MAQLKYVAFLRGMNLGRRRITNPELAAAFEAIGLSQVSVYQASGNVVFESSAKAASLTPQLEHGLERELGYPVPTFLRSLKALQQLVASPPFGDRATTNRGGKAQVVFLTRKPAAKAAAATLAFETDADWLALEGPQLLWWPALGVGKSELDFKALEKHTGPTTVRTVGTVERIVKKFS